MTALALDPGISTGWARSDGRNGVFSLREYDDHGQAVAMFSDWLEAELDREPPVYLAVERAVFRRAVKHGNLVVTLCGVAHALAWSRDVPRTGPSANDVRAWLGISRIPKAVEPSKAARDRLLDKAVLAAVRARGFNPADEHAADACALLAMVERRAVREAA